MDGHAVLVGRERLLATGRSRCPQELARAKAAAEAARPYGGRRRLGRRGARPCSSSPTPSSRPARRPSRELRALGLQPVLLTGDNAAVAAAVAAQVGIDDE